MIIIMIFNMFFTTFHFTILGDYLMMKLTLVRVRRYIRVIRKVTLSLGPAFTSYSPPLFQWYLQSKEIFIKSQYQMLKLTI